MDMTVHSHSTAFRDSGCSPPLLLMRAIQSVALAALAARFFPSARAQPAPYTGGPQLAVSEPSADHLDETPYVKQVGNGVLVVWTRWDKGQADVMARLLFPNAPPGPIFIINSETSNNQMAARMAVHNNDTVYTVWQSDQDGPYAIYGQLWTLTGTILQRSGSEQRISSMIAFDQQQPDIAVVQGDFVTTWQVELVSGNRDLAARARFIGPNGELIGSEFTNKIVGPSPAPTFYTSRSIRLLPFDGGFLSIADQWLEFRPSGPTLQWSAMYNRYIALSYHSVSNRVPTHQQNLAPLDTGGLGSRFGVMDNARRPAGTALSSNTALLVWDQPNFDHDGSRGIFIRPFSIGQISASSRIRLNSRQTGEQCCAEALTLSSGDAVVAWESEGQNDDGTRGVFARIVNSTAFEPAEAEFSLSADLTRNQREISLSPLGSGFFATWRRNKEIVGRAFGTPWNAPAPLHIATTTTARMGTNPLFTSTSSLPATTANVQSTLPLNALPAASTDIPVIAALVALIAVCATGFGFALGGWFVTYRSRKRMMAGEPGRSAGADRDLAGSSELTTVGSAATDVSANYASPRKKVDNEPPSAYNHPQLQPPTYDNSPSPQ